MARKQTGLAPASSRGGRGSKRARADITPEPTRTPLPTKRRRPQAQEQETSHDDNSVEDSAPNPNANLVGPAPGPSVTAPTIKQKKKDKRSAEQIILDEHEKHLPKVPKFDETWTKEVEAEFLREWEHSDKAQAFATLNAASHKYMLALWKQCIRIFRCSPFAILSPLRGFEYNESDNKIISINDRDIHSPIWRIAFHKKFVQLLSLSLWEPSTHREMTVLFLQYAIICRSDDRRAWDMPLPTESRVLAKLKAVVRQGPLPCSVHEIHWYLRQASELPPSLESDMLFSIGNSVKLGNAPAPEVTVLGSPKYWIDTSDLDSVLDALHTFSGRGFPALTRTEEAHIVSKESRERELPRISHLIDFQTRAWLHELRQVKVRCMEKATGGPASKSASFDDKSDGEEPEGPAESLESSRGLWFRPGSPLGQFRQ